MQMEPISKITNEKKDKALENELFNVPNWLFLDECSIFKKVASWKGKRTKVTPTYVKKMAAFWLKRSTSPHQSFSDQGMSCRILMENFFLQIKSLKWYFVTKIVLTYCEKKLF